MHTYRIAKQTRRVCAKGGALLAVCLLSMVAFAAEPAANTTAETLLASPMVNLAQKWGIQVSGIFLSAGGNMVDFRYKVLDPAKAAVLTKADAKPELRDQTSGAKLVVPNDPKVGPLRQTTKQPVAGKMYFMLFANTQHHVKSGDRVSVQAGDFKAENLIVE